MFDSNSLLVYSNIFDEDPDIIIFYSWLGSSNSVSWNCISSGMNSVSKINVEDCCC